MKKFRVTITVENLSEFEQVPGLQEQTVHCSIGERKERLYEETNNLSIGEKFSREFLVEIRGREMKVLARELLVY